MVSHLTRSKTRLSCPEVKEGGVLCHTEHVQSSLTFTTSRLALAEGDTQITPHDKSLTNTLLA